MRIFMSARICVLSCAVQWSHEWAVAEEMRVRNPVGKWGYMVWRIVQMVYLDGTESLDVAISGMRMLYYR
jgi:hypothetical protein